MSSYGTENGKSAGMVNSRYGLYCIIMLLVLNRFEDKYISREIDKSFIVEFLDHLFRFKYWVFSNVFWFTHQYHIMHSEVNIRRIRLILSVCYMLLMDMYCFGKSEILRFRINKISWNNLWHKKSWRNMMRK